MAWSDWDTADCPVGRTVDRIGDRWTLLVLRELFQGVHRFGAIRERLGISRTVLSERLSRLAAEGLVVAEAYRDPGQRERHEYRLTERGQDLRPVLLALLEFGARHLSGPDGPAMEMRRAGSDESLRLAAVDTAGVAVGADEVRVRPGPGARRRVG